MNEEQINSFKAKLDEAHAWPELYTFKFIVPKGKEEEVRKLFAKHTPSERDSKNGNYTSFTFEMMMHSSNAVVEVYQQAAVIEGIIAL